MTNPQIVSSIIGVVLAVTIYLLVRRDHLAPRQAIRWSFVALIVLFLGTFPIVVDWLGHAVGISYPPIIPLIIGLGAALIKILLMDIERNKMNVTQDRIIQKLAMLEAEIESVKTKS
ncbi:DUF2304 domain-containing protein [Pseudoalteromonas sp. C2R02]|uniref:DUF2304 domain-containing protein n=1 Tax=Pseudoalteromonas sp. C2R02 TaxID=2841565 RepID=UPI001C09FF14|nr:DUF2304 domain-containing protein [Pseudoalteromonas sp. C2R02]MBU2972647.1 DUF2304 domain-containing protein [Pseudoalteromonas sp. C2R02]